MESKQISVDQLLNRRTHRTTGCENRYEGVSWCGHG